MNKEEEFDETQDLADKAQFYILNQKYSEALKILKKLTAEENAGPHIFYLYGLALEGSNSFEEAKNAFRRVIELDPEHKEARQHLDKLIDG
ncbi:tetratricopeptide repeat protein [candidate division WOR-3 bacterium]|uniref:Tetratricopeptide repeat protein n=1 Tax=candidate division WOR-3 bacterium TaxID=2052148 RepID=A0A9D5K7V0_UNCW3|nr:tetratricopeptide repeat protein [candidate division WOR-3 bacterium]MBD3363946.1 tetratricopeptide repeat protein [candidate division WOR-3 bacterium]